MSKQGQGSDFERVMKDGKERAGKRANPKRKAIKGIVRSALGTIRAKRDLNPRVLEALLALDTKTIRETRDLSKLGSLLGKALMWVITSELPTAPSVALSLLNAFQEVAATHSSKSKMFDFEDDEDTDEPHGPALAGPEPHGPEPRGPALALQVGTGGFTLQPQNNGFSDDDNNSSESPRATATETPAPAGPATEPPAGPATDPSREAANNLLGLSSSQTDLIGDQPDLTASQMDTILDAIAS
jgi:hypothetical protein